MKVECRKRVNNYFICCANNPDLCKYYKLDIESENGKCVYCYETLDSWIEKCSFRRKRIKTTG